MTGRDKSPRSTTEAPMMPVEAARITPMMVTVIASPPCTLPNRFCMVFIMPSAMPDRSSIRPIKMNMGIATRTQLSIIL